MLETGGILIVMGVIFAVGAVGEGILSLFYRRYLRDTADMGRPGKKLVKLTKLRYETSYYLNGTVHNAKTMVNGMLEHYRLAGLRLWTWHHMATLAAFLCGVTGFAIGGTYVIGRYVPEVKEFLHLSGMNALIYTLAGAALAAMLIFWQNLLDNRTKRRRLETNLVDYFDNEKFHQLGREIALSGRVREIAGDRGRREDPGSEALETEMTARSGNMAAGNPGGTEEFAAAAVGMSGASAGNMNDVAADSMSGGDDAAKAEEPRSLRKERGKATAAATKVSGKKGAAGVMTIGDVISSGEAFEAAESEAEESAARTRSGARKKAAATSTRARAKNVQIAQEEMEERKATGARRKGKNTRDVIVALNPESSLGANGLAANSLAESGAERGDVAEEPDRLAEMEAAATAPTTPPAAKRRRLAGKGVSAAGTEGNPNSGEGTGAENSSGNLYGDAGRNLREEELLKLLREYMGL
ncbi:MAG: hypothetical protein LUE29_04710 [Lachnospiraceae bacterium]|nr:hypothetical protein [Lachnospiraceae bacterium]